MPLQRFLIWWLVITMSMPTDAHRMEKIVSLCKRRGFIFQSSEIYGGLNGAWDYGPLGVERKRNLKNYWWRVMVHGRDDVLGMDGAILTHAEVLKASGHVEGFWDPMIDCRIGKAHLRADQLVEERKKDMTKLWRGRLHRSVAVAIWMFEVRRSRCC